MWYHISEPNSYLALTGAGIDGVKICKKCFVMPFQKVHEPADNASLSPGCSTIQALYRY